MSRGQMIVAFLAGTVMLMAFVIGVQLTGTPAAQHAPISSMMLGFLAILATQIWNQNATDKKLEQIGTKADKAAAKAEDAAAAAAQSALPGSGVLPPPRV
jgi:hypothetical protein